MSVTLNTAGREHAASLIADGKADKTSDWSFSAADGNAMLGAGGDDWANYASWHLGIDAEQTDKKKAHYAYPFGKGGKVYRSALIAAKQRAAQYGSPAVEAAASSLIESIDGKAFEPTMHRAYSVLNVKSMDSTPDFVTITGIASTPTTDRMGDVVEPLGARFKTPMPLLWQHDAEKPVGNVTFATPTAKGIPFTAQLPNVKEPGTLKDRVDEAIQSVKYGLVAAVSIGFQPVKDAIETIKGGGYRFKEWEWLELSLVTIPANSEAVVNTIKALDLKHLPATGPKARKAVRLIPGDSGASKRKSIKLEPRNEK